MSSITNLEQDFKSPELGLTFQSFPPYSFNASSSNQLKTGKCEWKKLTDLKEDKMSFAAFLLFLDGKSARALITLQMKKWKAYSPQEKLSWAGECALSWINNSRSSIFEMIPDNQLHPFFTEFGSRITNLNLTHYDLTPIVIKSLLEISAKDCPNVKQIRLYHYESSGNKPRVHTKVKAEILSLILNCFKSLESLSIGSFWNHTDDFDKLRTFIPQLKKLPHVSFPAITYHETIYAFAQDLANTENPHLFDNLLKKTTSKFVKGAIDKALKKETTLTSVEKTEWRYQRIANWVGTSRTHSLEELLTDKTDLLEFMDRHGSQVKELHLRVSNVFSMKPEESLEIVKKCPNIEKLVVPRTEEAFLVKFAQLASFKKLEHLRLEFAKISNSWLKAFLQMIPICPNLRTIGFFGISSIENVTIDTDTIQLLVSIIQRLPKLESIELKQFKLSNVDKSTILMAIGISNPQVADEILSTMTPPLAVSLIDKIIEADKVLTKIEKEKWVKNRLIFLINKEILIQDLMDDQEVLPFLKRHGESLRSLKLNGGELFQQSGMILLKLCSNLNHLTLSNCKMDLATLVELVKRYPPRRMAPAFKLGIILTNVEVTDKDETAILAAAEQVVLKITSLVRNEMRNSWVLSSKTSYYS